MFINIPDNYSSMWGELNFEYNSTVDSDLVVELQDDNLGETIAVKKFYSSQLLKLNVTPLLFDSMLPKAQFLETGLSTADRGFPKISLIVDSLSSSSRQFTYATEQVESPLLLTSMPTGRLLYANESDDLTILLGEDSLFESTIQGAAIGGDGTLTTITTMSDESGGAKILRINANDFVSDYQSLSVTLWCDSEQIGQVDYTLSAGEASGYRIAWISKRGSIEHYTFPVIEEQVRLNSGATTYSLRSAYGTAQELEALGEVLTSPTLWRADATSYTPIELLTTQLTLRSEGALMIANFKISENG